jgi:hypothetical protein
VTKREVIMAQQGKKRGVGSVIALSLVALLFAAVVAYGGLMAYSVHRVNVLFTDAKSSYAKMKADLEAQEYSDELESARLAATFTSEANAQMEGWQWDVAAVLPVIGTDVQAARSLGSISDDLSQGAVIPVLDSWDKLASSGIITNGQVNLLKVPTAIAQVKDLVLALSDASEMVDDCKERVAEVPESHFDTLNESTATLTEAIESADEALVKFDEISQAFEDLSSVLSGNTGE